MLAEPRDKQKWSSDPRNIHWASDKNKFGYQMMSRMGWSEGKGLGANENGNVSHVKVSKKNNNLGIGAKVSHEDNWLAHQDDFNSLLQTLNKKQAPQMSSNINDSNKPRSLEATVKKSKKKIFYSKFVKSKDLSRASKADMDSIFGNRSKSAPATPCDSENESGNDSEGSAASCPPEAKGFVTTTSQLSMAEYFASKMAKKKEKITQDESSCQNDSDETKNDGDVIDDTVCLVKTKKSKKQKRKTTDAELEPVKTKKRKRVKESLCAQEDSSSAGTELDSPEIETENCEQITKKHKKKSKKRHKERQ